MEIISRSEAKAQGLALYFTGKPCKRGHVCDRAVSKYECMECRKVHSRKYRKSNHEAIKERKRKYYEANIEKERDRSLKYGKTNAQKINERRRKYQRNNPEMFNNRKHKYREKTKRNESALDTLALLANLSKLKEMDNTGASNE